MTLRNLLILSNNGGNCMSYTTAIYLRLSDDDNDLDTIKTESSSIAGQRIIINDFINSHTELKKSNLIEYCDDGYSGVNFSRPSVIKLLDDVKSGIINCIIVKDLSRFGRNLIEVGNYLEQIFPIFNIRFIAINDNYDSSTKNSCTSNIEIAFRNLMNEEYSRDISAKVKATKKIQKKQGLFIGGAAPYGYKAENKNLVIDECAADIVKKIFEMAEMEISFINIAKALNSENIPSRSNYSGRSSKKNYWKAKDISNILHNRVYVGTLINNRKKSISPRVVKENSVQDWIIFENHHEAIIDAKTFERVQKCFNKSTPRNKSKCFYEEFKRKVYCKGCGKVLQRHYISNSHFKNKETKSFFYKCDYGIYDNCCTERVYIEHLKEIVTNFLNTYLNIISNKIKAIKQKQTEIKNKALKNISDIDAEIKQIESTILMEYTNYRGNVISKDEFVSRREKLSNKIHTLKLKKEKINSDLKAPEIITETEKILKDFFDYKTITDEMIGELVNKIYISSNSKIEIEVNFKDIFNI